MKLWKGLSLQSYRGIIIEPFGPAARGSGAVSRVRRKCDSQGVTRFEEAAVRI